MASRAEALPRSSFLVLLSLADRARHGLGIVEEVERRTGGDVKLGPGTLYGTLRRLDEKGLIVETPIAPDPADDDTRRRYYELTPAGAEAVRSEAERMSALVAIARRKDVLEEGA